MKLTCPGEWLPPKQHNHAGEPRQVGVEIEFAGVDPDYVIELLASHFGGSPESCTRAEYELQGSRFGDFKLELDATAVKQLAERQAGTSQAGQGQAEDKSALEGLADTVGDLAMDVFTLAAEQLVPWEIVSPPVPVGELHELTGLVRDLRAAGALGTRHAMRFAFGVHLNPDLPALDAGTILSYLRAYVVLYDWIASQEQIDTARKITPYIDHFNKDYIALVSASGYQPGLPELIDDYLQHNPTRNRSLDMLPLFAHLDEDRVRRVIDDPRIKPRPTFHYRLPNCDIDSPRWNIDVPWSLWLQVEKLAHDPDLLGQLVALLNEDLSRLTHGLDGRWARKVGKYIDAQ